MNEPARQAGNKETEMMMEEKHEFNRLSSTMNYDIVDPCTGDFLAQGIQGSEAMCLHKWPYGSEAYETGAARCDECDSRDCDESCSCSCHWPVERAGVEDEDRLDGRRVVWSELDQFERGLIKEGRIENMRDAEFSDARLSGIDFSRADLAEADFSGAVIEDCDFEFANIDGADFSGAVLKDCKFYDISFSGGDLEDAEFISCDIRYIEFRRVDMTNTTFKKCDMYRTEFNEVDLENVKFVDCDTVDD